MTGRDLVTDILQDINVVGAGEVPDDHDAHFALRRLNTWIDSLALDNLALLYVNRTTQVLASNIASYTIGTGGDINILRPDHFEAVTVILDTAASPRTEWPLEQLTELKWYNLTQKTLANGLPQATYYDRKWTDGLARIYVWPIPNVSTTELVLYSLQPLLVIPDLNTEFTLAPGYAMFFETNAYNLIASAFGKAVTPDQKEAAAQARVRVKRANIRPVDIPVDSALLHHGVGWSITTGETR